MRLHLFPLAVLYCPLALAGQSVQSVQSAGSPPYEIYAGYSLLSNSFNGIPGSRQALNGEEASQVPFPNSQKSASQERRGKNQTVRAGFGDVTGAGQQHLGDQKARIFGMFVVGDQQNTSSFGG